MQFVVNSDCYAMHALGFNHDTANFGKSSADIFVITGISTDINILTLCPDQLFVCVPITVKFSKLALASTLLNSCHSDAI